MKFELGYGKIFSEVDVDENNIIGVLKPNQVMYDLTDIEEVKRALSNPIGSKRLKDIVKCKEKVVIITSDITRPMPSRLVLPVILEELFKAGVELSDIKIVFGLGCHRKQTEEEKKHIVGEMIYSKIECVDSDICDCIHMGTTSQGTPVDIFRIVAEADRRICLGNIEYHYFAGYSGGAKAIMPGVSTKAAIQNNHSRMVMPEACTGKIDGNPVREDIEEVMNFIPVDFILNVVLDEKKKIIKAVAGHFSKAHRVGCDFLDKIYKITIPEKADIVLVSPGGYPKDINLYQAQKALDNASHAVKDGGIIILLASCVEGLGEEVFERWMRGSNSPEDMIEQIQRKFELGGHKAAAIAMVLQKARIFLVSDMQEEFVRCIFLEPYNDLNNALKEARKEFGADAKVIIMPFGGSTLPISKDE